MPSLAAAFAANGNGEKRLMAWTPYKNWAGNVKGARVRVLPKPDGSVCFGPSESTIILRSGSVGTVENVLSEGDGYPKYVQFKGYRLNCTHAVEVRIRKAENSELMWKEFSNMLMKDDEALVMVLYKTVNADFEIEYEAR